MNILGVSFDYHNAAAVLLTDGHIAAAALSTVFTKVVTDPVRQQLLCST